MGQIGLRAERQREAEGFMPQGLLGNLFQKDEPNTSKLTCICMHVSMAYGVLTQWSSSSIIVSLNVDLPHETSVVAYSDSLVAGWPAGVSYPWAIVILPWSVNCSSPASILAAMLGIDRMQLQINWSDIKRHISLPKTRSPYLGHRSGGG